jgi:D-alanine-D-alanine ligase
VVLGDPVTSILAPEVRGSDVVFVALHGGIGEDGRVQALLELAGIPYVGSRPGPSAVAMDKLWTLRLAAQAGIPTATHRELRGAWSTADALAAFDAIGADAVVVKPVDEGSAVGVHILESREALAALGAQREGALGRWLVERYVAGRELTVPILWGETCPVIEIRPREGFYDYRNKYTAGCTEYDCPADLDEESAATLQTHALRLFAVLDLRDMARIDFRVHPSEGPFLLEANTIPGMTATSLLPMGAAARGIDFVRMCDRLCRIAHERGPDPT